jgi:hypothetical protein
MARGERHGDRGGVTRARGETVAGLAILAATAYGDHAGALRSHLTA